MSDKDDTYNKFRGYAVKPSKNGTYDLLKELWKMGICSDDDGAFKWTFAWKSFLIRKPGEKPGTSIVLRGGKGAGKTQWEETFGYLLDGAFNARKAGKLYIPAIGFDDAFDKFNKQYAFCRLLHVDEIRGAINPKLMSKINSIITGTYLQHHAKYKDQATIFNDTMPVFIGNYDFVMPATEDERRQTVLDVSGQFIGNIKFFQEMRYELECGGYRRLMYDLLEFDCDSVDLRRPYETEALSDQKLQTVEAQVGIKAWWRSINASGELWDWTAGTDEEGNEVYLVPVDSVRKDYFEFLEKRKKPIPTDDSFGIQFKALFPKIDAHGNVSRARNGRPDSWLDKVRSSSGGRNYLYAIPKLKISRACIDHVIGRKSEWDDADATWPKKSF